MLLRQRWLRILLRDAVSVSLPVRRWMFSRALRCRQRVSRFGAGLRTVLVAGLHDSDNRRYVAQVESRVLTIEQTRVNLMKSQV